MKCLKSLSCIVIFMHYNLLNAGAGWGLYTSKNTTCGFQFFNDI